MTPAINLAKKRKIQFTVHQYQHDADAKSFGLEAAEKLGLDEEQVFKTLVVEFDGKELAVAILPVNTSLNMKLMAKALGAKKAQMANKADVERTTGYVLGGVSPLGQKKRLKTIIDGNAQKFPTIFVSAGRRGLEIELAADDMISLLGAKYAQISQH
ncbi:Cys-tRNA(Pro) deacylase [Aliiglaciecola sp. 3_MG-2023]|uniref:Cys-tRNA(Pro) deacylase n=1 Tax=Aliiglaciecola sp. 3_MG-2023 TaxID=3062644 RepID=UPI0026E48C7A|nr:Cys-tRNA(Pro) deacylase [Aliiglaciecola sp. 3_MG-2023]MDO6693435.1 Cys-tRNA(Pro) deacylase [Aliiglaciecola sp. 3_MG-2023]